MTTATDDDKNNAPPHNEMKNDEDASAPETPVPAPGVAETKNQKDDDGEDGEGLPGDVDVVIVGTGLVQSVLAAAFSRSAGWTVMHVDGSEHYGGQTETVYTLPYLLNNAHQTVTATATAPEKEKEKMVAKDDVRDHTIVPLLPAKDTERLEIHSIGKVYDERLRTSDDDHVKLLSSLTEGTRVSTPFGVGIVKGVAARKKTGDDDSTDETGSYMSLEIELDMTSFYHNERDGHHKDKQSHRKTNMTTLYVGIPVVSTTDADAENRTEASSDSDSDSTEAATNATSRMDAHTNNFVSARNIRILSEIQSKAILDKHSRSFMLDASPCLLFADGLAVDSLIESKVSDYLEFKALEGVLIYNNGGDGNDPNSNGDFVAVPCNKNGVFRSSYLNPMEKRRLVKFLQLALEYHQEEQVAAKQAAAEASEQARSLSSSSAAAPAAVLSLNERRLNQGRSLPRPQNKAVASSDLSDLNACIFSNMDLETYLRDKQKLSQKVANLVRYAMVLETGCGSGGRINTGSSSTSSEANKLMSSLSLKDGISALCRHVQALGRYGTTAFLVPLFGNELPQAFCRCAAVYGATYLLRRDVLGVIVDNGSDREEEAKSKKRVEGVVLERARIEHEPSTAGGTDTAAAEEDSKKPSAVEGKRIRCKHVIAPRQALPSSYTTTRKRPRRKNRVQRRISILRGKPKLVDSDGDKGTASSVAATEHDSSSYSHHQQRHLVLFPPYSVDSEHQHSAIQALLMDEHVNVAPRIPTCGCTIVHLTTTSTTPVDITSSTEEYGDDSSGISSSDIVLGKALKALLRDAQKDELEEIFHVAFSYPLDDDGDVNADGDDEDFEGLHVLSKTKQPLVADDAFEQARSIFHQLCPDKEFLAISEEVEAAIKERLGGASGVGDNDDEAERVLSKAMELIQKQQASEANEQQQGPASSQLPRKEQEHQEDGTSEVIEAAAASTSGTDATK